MQTAVNALIRPGMLFATLTSTGAAAMLATLVAMYSASLDPLEDLCARRSLL